jgi:DNA-binding transcriptional ArsR family regulator
MYDARGRENPRASDNICILSRLVNNQRQVSTVFSALADPTRRRIVERLQRDGEVPVTVLAEPFRISLPAFSRHLRVLEHARLIQRRRDGRLHLIQARPAGAVEARRWMDRYVAGWESSFDALDRLLAQDPPSGGGE